MGENRRERQSETDKSQEQKESTTNLLSFEPSSVKSAFKTNRQCQERAPLSCLTDLQIVDMSPLQDLKLKDLSKYGGVRIDASGKAELVSSDMQIRFSYGPSSNQESFKWSGNQLMQIVTPEKTYTFDTQANVWRIKNATSPVMSRQDSQSNMHEATFSQGLVKKTYELSGPITIDRLFEQYQAFLKEAAPINDYFTPEKMQEMKERLTQREGAIPYAYLDSVGVPTACIGFNLLRPEARKRFEELGVNFDQLKKDAYVNKQNKSVMLTPAQMDKLLEQDMTDTLKETLTIYPDFARHPKEIQDVMFDLTFNMGSERLRKFKNMNQALNQRDYKTAETCLKNSEYIQQGQTGPRGKSNLEAIKLAATSNQ